MEEVLINDGLIFPPSHHERISPYETLNNPWFSLVFSCLCDLPIFQHILSLFLPYFFEREKDKQRHPDNPQYKGQLYSPAMVLHEICDEGKRPQCQDGFLINIHVPLLL